MINFALQEYDEEIKVFLSVEDTVFYNKNAESIHLHRLSRILGL